MGTSREKLCQMRSLCTLILAVLLIGVAPHSLVAQGRNAPPPPDRRGTEQQPLVIEAVISETR
jgi:hypothetical protein